MIKMFYKNTDFLRSWRVTVEKCPLRLNVNNRMVLNTDTVTYASI